MHRKPSTLLPLLALVLLSSALGTPALATVTCRAGNPSASTIVTTPSTDFTVNGDGTVTHSKTGLMWKTCAEGLSGAACATGTAATMTWASALNAAVTANAANAGLGFANHTDWRLPNQKELQSIVESCGYNPSINQDVFPATPTANYFWSASTYLPDPANAGIFSFSDGPSDAATKSFGVFYVRLVRGGQSPDSFDGLAPTYTVAYNGNGSIGGSVPVDSGEYAPAATVTVLGSGSLVRTGYTFAGWNEAANGNGAAHAAATTFDMPTANVTLYAQWTPEDRLFSDGFD
jgi:uncharacterized repeat protein (TIGR02543 family)